MASPTIIRLNVGGRVYCASKSLLETYPDSMLARLVSDTWNAPGNTEIFIDRDGERFRHVLDYLRDPEMFVPDALICRELDYFGVPHSSIASDIGLPNLQPRLRECVIKAGKTVFEAHAEGVLKFETQEIGFRFGFDIHSDFVGISDSQKAMVICLARFSPAQLSEIWVREFGIKCNSTERRQEGSRCTYTLILSAVPLEE